MSTSISKQWLLLIGLLFCCLPLAAQEEKLHWEAEELAATAKIVEGGDLLIIRAPDPAALPFSGERALTFVPRGKASALELKITVPKEGVYRVRIHAVVGPSCGIYTLWVNGEERGNQNYYDQKTMLSSKHPSYGYGFVSKRALFTAGENALRFKYEGAQGRMGDLVLDTLELMPYVRPRPTVNYTPYDKELPAGEKLGPNLLQNGGFEDFQPTDRFLKQFQHIKGWQFNSVVPQKIEPIVRDPAKAHAGGIVLCLAPDILEDNAVLYQTLPFQSEKRYRITFFTRGKGDMEITVYQPRGAKADDTLNGYNIFQAAGEWQRYSFLFSPSRAGKVTSASLALYADAESEIYFDDVTVQEVLP